MPQHFEQRILPYLPDKMFDLVADIERYPEFLPWCREARICSRKGNAITAELVVGHKVFRDAFTSVVTLDRPNRISVNYGGGPLSQLSNEWRFAPINGNGCELTFYVDFAFRSPVIGAMINVFFDKAFRKMAAAFEERAKELYGVG
ncbi:MAG: type II toxin-antitoxin system RatA family toxin [Alphaproteobacteria bacterium]|nr:type II toxin-antitoxin system RatA family toxin [Alphaproteobacteria bacterium]